MQLKRESPLKNFKVDDELKQAQQYFDNSDYPKALFILGNIVEIDDIEKENLSKAFFLMANIFHIQGQVGKAIKAFNKCLSLDPSHTDAAISLSVVYNDIGKYEEAKKVFDQANNRIKHGKDTNHFEDDHINKKFALKHFEIAEMYMTYNRLDEALFEFNKAVGLDSENLEARIRIAKVYAKKNFVNKALDELRSLKNDRPDYTPARVALGVLYYGCGKVLEARSEWERILVKDPRNEEALMYLNLSQTATETTL